MTDVIELYRYHVWANDKVFQRLRELPEDILCRELQSVFPSIGETLAHMYVVDGIWLCALLGDSAETSPPCYGRWAMLVHQPTLCSTSIA